MRSNYARVSTSLHRASIIQPGSVLGVAMAKCLECRFESGAGTSCRRCYETLTAALKPLLEAESSLHCAIGIQPSSVPGVVLARCLECGVESGAGRSCRRCYETLVVALKSSPEGESQYKKHRSEITTSTVPCEVLTHSQVLFKPLLRPYGCWRDAKRTYTLTPGATHDCLDVETIMLHGSTARTTPNLIKTVGTGRSRKVIWQGESRNAKVFKLTYVTETTALWVQNNDPLSQFVWCRSRR